jgi:superfamily II helicase
MFEGKDINDLMKYHEEIITRYRVFNWLFSTRKGLDFMGANEKSNEDKTSMLLYLLNANIEMSKLCSYVLEKTIISKTIEYNEMNYEEYLIEINKITNDINKKLIDPSPPLSRL